MQIVMHDIDALAIRLVRPVHVSDDITGQADLLYPSNPLIDVRYDGSEQVAMGCNDLAQVRRNA